MLRAAPLLALVLAGCLPSSQRDRTTALLPADSLSRRIAAGAPVDTLTLEWASAEGVMELPTSLLWLGGTAASDPTAGDSTVAVEEKIVVADTRRGSLFVLNRGGRLVREVQPENPALDFPYLAGAVGDTVFAFSRGGPRLDGVSLAENRVVRSVPVPGEDASAALVAEGGGFWVKHTPEDGPAALVRLDRRGRVAARHPLPGPYWRHLGFLRAWGPDVVSLSGYRPVVDVLAAGTRSGARPDTLALRGFDSSQLLRSHQFLIGEVDEPPLLTSGAFGLGDRLFVLNLRPDHLRIDVFGRDGRLQRVLVYRFPPEALDTLPVDLAVQADGVGARLAVVVQRPGSGLTKSTGRVWMLRWDGPDA